MSAAITQRAPLTARAALASVGDGAVPARAQGLCRLGDRLGGDARLARRHRRSTCSPRWSPCSACGSPPCRPTTTIASATARRRRWRRWSRSVIIVDLRDRHRLARGRAADRRAPRPPAPITASRFRSIAIVATLGAARLSALGHPPHRLGRDPHRQRPLPERPAAQPGGDRRFGARPVSRLHRRRPAVRHRHRRLAAVGRLARLDATRSTS